MCMQVSLLQRRARERGWDSLEVLTIDKFQGRDKPIVLISLVRSNAQCVAGKLLADWRRINVAVTRAQRKLVIVGSATTISSVPLMQTLLGVMGQQRSVLQL